MNRRKKWWILEVVSWVVWGVAVGITPELPLWKYFALGVCFGLYAVCYRRQGEL